MGWELRISRLREERRRGRKVRTVSSYQVHHDGNAVGHLSGFLVECGGPGDNSSHGSRHDLRIEAGTYPLSTHDGSSNEKYKTIGYSESDKITAIPRPSLRLLETGSRDGILIHPANHYIWSVGCLNPGLDLQDASSNLKFTESRALVIALIDDLRTYYGRSFPTRNNVAIHGAAAIITGEPI